MNEAVYSRLTTTKLFKAVTPGWPWPPPAPGWEARRPPGPAGQHQNSWQSALEGRLLEERSERFCKKLKQPSLLFSSTFSL